MDILNPETRRDIREAIYPFSEAIPLKDVEEIVDKIQIKTAEIQASKSRNEALEDVIELLKRDYIPGKDAAILIKDIRKLKK